MVVVAALGRVAVPDRGVGSPHATTTRTRANKIGRGFTVLGRHRRRFRFRSDEKSIRGWGAFGLFESDASVVGPVMDLEAVLVDDDVVVVPAEGDQIVE